MDATSMAMQGTNTGFIAEHRLWSREVFNASSDWIGVFESANCRVEYWVPRERDAQDAHDQDEIYVVTQGTGAFRMRQRIRAVHAGDLIFVPAGELHRFEAFSEGFSVWVVHLPERAHASPHVAVAAPR